MSRPKRERLHNRPKRTAALSPYSRALSRQQWRFSSPPASGFKRKLIDLPVAAVEFLFSSSSLRWSLLLLLVVCGLSSDDGEEIYQMQRSKGLLTISNLLPPSLFLPPLMSLTMDILSSSMLTNQSLMTRPSCPVNLSSSGLVSVLGFSLPSPRMACLLLTWQEIANSRKDFEGSLFVVKRNTQPRFQFIVMNRRNTGSHSYSFLLRSHLEHKEPLSIENGPYKTYNFIGDILFVLLEKRIERDDVLVNGEN
ncbi:hypothetical protein G4B88_027082 [Cannabis sativa]|uniref:Uncharacterized protein n=1 Tax=Cannabis sativa TaxID=3483 RepID=A0A7J6HPY9_CANSA|nr:hypothetical protein G4B88_027082 [Cannabis sativa]